MPENVLNRHPTQEHRLEIDARNATFRAFELSGKNLISTNHVNSDDVEAYLDMMGEKREDLEKTWIARRMELDQCLELQLFYREDQQNLSTEIKLIVTPSAIKYVYKKATVGLG